jgi:hypothetical protein
MSLSAATIRRLKRLPQVPNVWEGARISLPLPGSGESAPHMVIWMDGSEGTARSLETADESFGHEALVRGLIKAIEHPQGPYPPIRPKKVLVSDREEQFYLRGVLSDLEIAVEYAPELPMVEHLFARFEEFHQNREPDLPAVYEQLIRSVADELWDAAPWNVLEDHQVLQIKLDCWDVGSFYATVLGMMGQEHGVLLYRSIDSLRQFRLAACSDTAMEEMEKVFLSQDCIFCTYDIENPNMPHLVRPAKVPKFDDVSYGSIHPLEGMRAVLDPEEVLATYAALMALKRFFEKNKGRLERDELAEISQKIRITIPDTVPSNLKVVNVTVSTMPDLVSDLRGMSGDDEDDCDLDIQDDLVPEHALISTGIVPAHFLKSFQSLVPIFTVNMDNISAGGLPVMMVQTTKLKANNIMKFISVAGGVRGLAFEVIEGAPVQLGVVALADGQLQLIGEFGHAQVELWQNHCAKNNQRCALVIAQGSTKNSKPRPPNDKDILAVLETTLTDIDTLCGL